MITSDFDENTNKTKTTFFLSLGSDIQQIEKMSLIFIVLKQNVLI